MELNEEKLKKWEETFSFILDKMEEAIKRTEIFVELVRENQLQEQSRLNDSYHEIVERFKGQSKKETEVHGEQMNTMLKSLSTKIEEISDAENNRENALEQIQNTLHQEQNRFNKSFDVILDSFRLASNKSLSELIEKQEKAYTQHVNKILQFIQIIKFEKVWTNIGNGYNPSTGIFTAPRQGVYHITAVVMSQSGQLLYLHLKHNNDYTAGIHVTGDGYKTGTFDVVFSLQKGDTISVGCKNGIRVFSNNDKYTTFSGYLIA
ncbi:unnamed protein product [Mytilus edulis]|uniref:C1q domain-containing protein n=1 Tax=Mytilus edulis TaxID=6550 RepID=A0A8S3SKM6_MYTED|nr:unnamed protein product [Mytilus edulis]